MNFTGYNSPERFSNLRRNLSNIYGVIYLTFCAVVSAPIHVRDHERASSINSTKATKSTTRK